MTTSPNPSPNAVPPLDPETWVAAYGDYLYRFALGRLRDPIESENAVQETFLAALKAKDNFSGRSTERTWLTGILKHKIIDHLRKRYREKPVTDLKADEEAIDQFFDRTNHLKKQPGAWALHPDEVVANKEFWTIFHQCRHKLPANAAAAFSLREIEKLDGKEICTILGITQANFWVLLHRARLQLRECLERHWFEKNS